MTQEQLKEVTKSIGDAFYILDSYQFRKNYVDLKCAFSEIYPNFNIAYSYKTNYTPKLCKIVNELGGYAEVVSDMEMEIALRIGVLPQKIIWNGPVKNAAKVKQLLLTGGTVNIDSLQELQSISEIVKEFPNHQFHLGLRCNYGVGDGVISRFGVDTENEDFIEILSFIKNTDNVELIGLQCHFAKRSVEYWPARAKGMIKVIDKVEGMIGYVPKRIDLGGGIYGKMPECLKEQFSMPIPCYQDYAQAAATEFIKRFPNGEAELLIEPGSALAGDCMSFVGKVEGIKNVGKKYFATMLGSQKNISMTGVNPPMHVYEIGGDRKHYENMDIVGYTCIENDVLFHGFCGELAVGDYLEFSNCGSYSVVMKPPFIMPNFPVIDICDENIEIIKRGETFDDLFHTFAF